MSSRPRRPASLLALTLAVGLVLPAVAAHGAAVPTSQAAPVDEAAPVHLKLLATNDLHARLHPPVDGQGGAAYLAAHLQAVKAEHPAALHVDTGDAAGGFGGLSSRLRHEPTIEALDAMGLDVMAVGNHEFDNGLDELRRLHEGDCWLGDCGYRGGKPFAGASWQALAGNVVDGTTGETVFPATTVLEVDGIEVGFIGVTTTNVIVEEGNEDLEFLSWEDVTNDAAADLEAAGVDVVVVLRHVGGHVAADNDPDDCDGWVGRSAEFVWQDVHDAVDVVVDGHTHRAYVCDFAEWGVPLTTQAFEHGRMFTEIDLYVDPDTREVVDRAATNHVVDHSVAPDPDMLEIIDHATTWTTGRLKGTVRDITTGAGIGGATVFIGGPGTSTTTAADGTYATDVFAGNHPVTVEADGYEAANSGASVRIQETTPLDVALTPEGHEPEPDPEPEPESPDATDGACPEADARFTDVTLRRVAVSCLAAWRVTEGVGDGTRYDPARTVTRAQMASFLQRAVEESGSSLPAAPSATLRRDHRALLLTRWLDTLVRDHGVVHPG